MANLNYIYNKGFTHEFLGSFTYIAALEDEDSIGDFRVTIDNGLFIQETCTAANVTKGNGTWKRVKSINYVTLVDSTEIEKANSFIDLPSSSSGYGLIIFGNSLGYTNFVYNTSATVTLFNNSANVYTDGTYSSGSSGIVLRDKGTNLRIVNETGSSQIFNIEVLYNY